MQAFPTPKVLHQAGKRRHEKFLHTHKFWRPETAQARLKAWSNPKQLQASAAVVQAESLLALSLATMLQCLQKQLDEYPSGHAFSALDGFIRLLTRRRI